MGGWIRAIEGDKELLNWLYSMTQHLPLTVEAVYSHAVYVRVGSRQLVLLSQDEPVGPASLVVSCSRFDQQWDDHGWVSWRTIGVGLFVVHLSEVRSYRSDLAAIAAWDSQALRGIIGQVWRHGDVLSHVSDEVLHERLQTHVRLLLRGLENQDEAVIADSLRALIGLGPGSTPTGDDLLVGLVVGLSISHPSWAKRLRRAIPLPPELARLTTIPSTVALSEAAAGRFFSLVNETVQWLGSPPSADNSCVQGLLRRGHTSGRDTMAGIVLGLTAVSV